MSRIAYVNGQYVPHQDAAVHIEDRGYQFADGVYEVFAVHQGRMVGEQGHMDRLAHSLGELRIDWPMSARALGVIIREVSRRNRVRDGLIYLQITRGVARRDHSFPDNTESALVVTARRMPPLDKEQLRKGVGVITIPDIRWQRHDIKSVSLLPNIIGKQQAREAGAYEAWMVNNEGMITEGTASNAWIVTKDGELVTHNASHAILNGITRLSVLEAAVAAGVPFSERAFSVEEAMQAKEAFVTSSTSHVKAVTSIDGHSIGNGHIGELTSRMLDLYVDFIETKGGPQNTNTWN
ncbi:MAG TPA: D-amino-acid transaminase [Rhodospirillales bacterium]|jgi:D-alanine transaminase|nr:MAG: D-alanine aminotransferase [Alphaproteobacteria bacterium MarineAlpha3_Bin2]HIC28979.1 D-amino-acid transaminase [Rhodospirillales bacterium]HIM76743.1 D-amino-acid transaminase [Rhodospirillales bacterium]